MNLESLCSNKFWKHLVISFKLNFLTLPFWFPETVSRNLLAPPILQNVPLCYVVFPRCFVCLFCFLFFSCFSDNIISINLPLSPSSLCQTTIYCISSPPNGYFTSKLTFFFLQFHMSLSRLPYLPTNVLYCMSIFIWLACFAAH